MNGISKSIISGCLLLLLAVSVQAGTIFFQDEIMGPEEFKSTLTDSETGNMLNPGEDDSEVVIRIPFWRTVSASYLYTLIIILLVVALFQYRTKSLRRSNRILRERDIAAREVGRQKDLLSRRNKNIEDSLKYANRIQSAMLTTEKNFKQILPESFILHKPKDIVSGDFYWISEIKGKVFVAAIDCTGHGVPGAFMSLIGFELFRKIIMTQGIEKPGDILNALNDNFQEIFGNGDDISLRDGMDLAFCVIEKKEMVLEFAGAFNPLYLIRDHKLIEVKGDRYSIGADPGPGEPNVKMFNTQVLKLHKEDMIYLFSDGFADQFGGPEGKKYKYRRFRHLLLTIHNFSLEKQKQFLEDGIEEWRGHIEQVDDILVIGIKANF